MMYSRSDRFLAVDMGNLRVELLDGQNIRSADRNGKSDPYVVFNLRGERVFKSEVQRKTLTPKWNETFNTTVESRADDPLELEVYDWNQVCRYIISASSD
jgi:Ca2+-dependent lipid-binding protein